MFSYKPTYSKKNAFTVVILMFAVTALCLMTGYFNFKFIGIFQIVGIISLTAGLHITIRYILSSFRYYVDYEDGVLSLGVEKTQGKRISTVCCVAISSIKMIEKYTNDRKSEKDFEINYGRIIHKFNFCGGLFPKEKICVMIDFNGDPTVIYLECDDNFTEKLRYIRKNVHDEELSEE